MYGIFDQRRYGLQKPSSTAALPPGGSYTAGIVCRPIPRKQELLLSPLQQQLQPQGGEDSSESGWCAAEPGRHSALKRGRWELDAGCAEERQAAQLHHLYQARAELEAVAAVAAAAAAPGPGTRGAWPRVEVPQVPDWTGVQPGGCLELPAGGAPLSHVSSPSADFTQHQLLLEQLLQWLLHTGAPG